MPCFGGRGNVNFRLGGGGSVVDIILTSLNASFGSAYATDNPNSLVYLRNYALAKCLAAAWAQNARLGNQGNPMKLTTLLERVEAIYAMPKDPSITRDQRRQRIAYVEKRRGEPADNQFITDGLARILGPVFVALEFISFANAVVHVPDNTYPFGTVAPGAPWYSTVCHILVRTQKPAGWSEGQYRIAGGAANAFLDAVVPAWCTWTIYHPPEGHAPTNTPGGPSAGGFFLDTPNSLDYCVFP